jgi:hypothetical protein
MALLKLACEVVSYNIVPGSNSVTFLSSLQPVHSWRIIHASMFPLSSHLGEYNFNPFQYNVTQGLAVCSTFRRLSVVSY